MSFDFFSLPHSCDFCRKLVLYKPDSSWWTTAIEADSENPQNVGPVLSARIKEWLVEDPNNLPSIPNGYVIFDCTMREAKDAAAQGCSLCECIIENYHSPFVSEQAGGSFLAAFIDRDLKFSSRSNFRQSIDEMREFFRSVGKSEVGVKRCAVKSCAFQLIALPKNSAAAEVSGRPINPRPGSDESFHLAQKWLETCLNDHKMCPKPKTDFMPTRVVEIIYMRGLRCLRLCEKKDPEPYTALSYCWGDEQHVTTTSETVNRFLTRIHMEDLPATVRDAVIVTEKLGIMNLWIDALCIMQDDTIDKAREIAQMPLIYSQAMVTITASRASGVEKGFLHDRPRMGHECPEMVFELPFLCSSNQLGSVVLVPKPKTATEPLDLRAWALQERFFSPRILEFGSFQTRWICQHVPDDNCFTDGYVSSAVTNAARSDTLFQLGLQGILLSDYGHDPAIQTEIRGLWSGIVEVYTHRKLKLKTDRLPALSGIAARFGRALQDEYKAGLWESILPFELLWEVDSSRETALELRPQQYQGPSWSWASLDVPVRTMIPGSSYGEADVCIRVIACHIKIPAASANFSLYDASFGAVELGSLELRGRLQIAEWILPIPSSEDLIDARNTLRKGIGNGPDAKLPTVMHPDAEEPELEQHNGGHIPVFLLKIFMPQKEATWGLKGLVLKQNGDSTYSRLGVFESYQSLLEESLQAQAQEQKSREFQQFAEWLDSPPLQIITIV